MRIEASAPGKLVLLGEYAVLEGAPALVLAVDRRAHVTLTTLAGDAWEVCSPTLGVEARLRVDDVGATPGATLPAQLAWFAQLLAGLPFAASLPPCRIELDSASFFLEHAGAPAKLGLGSSAALTVAVLGALHALARRPPPTLDEGIRIHRAIQGNRGSGIDIAAALAGGLLRFRLGSGHTPQCTHLALPDTLHWRCVYSGRPASTSAMLAAIAAWREREPAACARHMDELATISRRGIEAVAQHDAARFLSSIRDHAQALAGLGEASGVDIMSRPHRELAALARRCGAAYKSCGAGGGDVGVTFAVDDGALQGFTTLAAQAGFPVIALEPDRAGLDVALKD